MAEQYEHMTLEIENGKVVKVDKPQNTRYPSWRNIFAGILEPSLDTLLNQSVASALNQLSAQQWEVFLLPPGSSHSTNSSNKYARWIGPPAVPNADRYQILLRREIRG